MNHPNDPERRRERVLREWRKGHPLTWAGRLWVAGCFVAFGIAIVGVFRGIVGLDAHGLSFWGVADSLAWVIVAVALSVLANWVDENART